jgi:hypothetical protein
MSRQERRDYIAIQAMLAFIGNDSMMVDKATTLRQKDYEEEDLTAVIELVEASYNVADLMMQESDQREKECDETKSTA